MQTGSRRARALRMRPGNFAVCLMCYLIAFGVPLLWEYAALRLLYPWKLAFTAPDVYTHLIKAFPVLDGWLTLPAQPDGAFSLRELLATREEAWLGVLRFSALLSWGITLLGQLLWRFSHRRPLFGARETSRAIVSCRLMLVLIWLINAAAALGVWFAGVQFITGRTLWDYVISFGIFFLNPLAAAFVSRFAASPAISGRHSYFKRI